MLLHSTPRSHRREEVELAGTTRVFTATILTAIFPSPNLKSLCYLDLGPSLGSRRRRDFMKPTLVVVADLGNFRAYHWDGDELHSTPRLELVDAFETVDARSKRVRNTLTVLEGRSANGGSNPKLAGAGSEGGQHKMDLEKQSR